MNHLLPIGTNETLSISVSEIYTEKYIQETLHYTIDSN